MRGGGTPRPLMVYIPGLDGTGFAASSQFDRLSRWPRMQGFGFRIQGLGFRI
jgi:hypothetical protein